MNQSQIQIAVMAAYSDIEVDQVKITPITEKAYRINVFSKYLPHGAAWEVSYMAGSHFATVHESGVNYDPPLTERYTRR